MNNVQLTSNQVAGWQVAGNRDLITKHQDPVK